MCAAQQTDVAYQEVKEIKSVPRGVGLWGDMVVVLNDDSKVEMRALDRWAAQDGNNTCGLGGSDSGEVLCKRTT